jgi:hypothetical protein
VNRIRSSTRLAAALVIAGTAGAPAFATENGGASPGLGAEGFLAGALPPPGTYAVAYLNHYRANRFNDGNGNELVPGFKVRATALAPRIVHMTAESLLGGQLGFYGILPLVDLKVDAAGTSDSRSGIGDLELAPMVAWHGPRWHTVAAIAVALPTGAYDANRLANIGNNYYTLRPIFAFSYLGESGLDVSSKITYSINSKNGDTDYKSGQYLHADYNVGWNLNPQWQLGLQGFLLHQFTADKQNGNRVGPDGFKGRVFAVGPALRYQGSAVSIEARWLKETQAEFRPEGSSFWLKAVWKL